MIIKLILKMMTTSLTVSYYVHVQGPLVLWYAQISQQCYLQKSQNINVHPFPLLILQTNLEFISDFKWSVFGCPLKYPVYYSSFFFFSLTKKNSLTRKHVKYCHDLINSCLLTWRERHMAITRIKCSHLNSINLVEHTWGSHA